jgi:hypothetical protein
MSPREFYVCPKCGSRSIEQNGAGGRHTTRDGRRYYQSGWWCWDCKPRFHFYGEPVEQFDHTEKEGWCPQCKEAPCLMTFAVRGTPMPGGDR